MGMLDQYSESSDNEANQPVPVKKKRKMSKSHDPRQICETIVKLHGRNIVTIPSSKLKKYEKCFGFDLSDNRVDFSDELCSTFIFIRYLNLSNNSLDKLPQDIYLMQNLIHFDVSRNNITALPLSLKAMTNLLWLDLRGNPFMESWTKFNPAGTDLFDPKDVKQIMTFLDAVTTKHDMLVEQRTQDFRDFTLICPRKASKTSFQDWNFFQEETLHEKCPFHKVSQNHPEALLSTVQVFDDCQVKMMTYPEKWIMWTISTFFHTLLPWLAGNMILVLVLVATFYDDVEFRSGLKHFENILPTAFSTYLDNGRSTIVDHLPLAMTNLFPIRPPI